LQEAQAPRSSEPAASSRRGDRGRERILKAAGRGFRLRGYAGIGVDGLAKEAGVTSGAFYGHFRSKEEAFQAAVTTGIDDFRAGVERFRAEYGGDWARVFAQWYLGKAYLEDIAGSCALPSLSPDVVRADEAVRTAYEAELRKLAAAVEAGLPAPTAEQKERDAWVFLALLAGGVTLARAVEDKNLEATIAAAVRDAVIALASPQ
jgi:AcrR family transcriptional regulator